MLSDAIQSGCGEACPTKGTTTWSGSVPSRNWEASYYRARYYDPASGRFISEDPIGLLSGTDLYVYASNNPVQLRDPRGLDPASSGSGGCPPKRDCKKEYDDCRKRALNDYNTCIKNALDRWKSGVRNCQAWRLFPVIGDDLADRCTQSKNNQYQRDEASCGSALNAKLANCLSRKTLCEMGL